ncbi:MAG: gliding motility-associated ABC transporter substrate-binding protein GldG [Flavobacteriales bacterium]
MSGMRGGMNKRSSDLLELLLGVAGLLLLLYIGSFVRLRADLTSEQRYTLRPATEELVEGLEDEVFVKVFLSGALPADLERLSRATRELLDELRVVGAERINYSFVDPNASADPETRNAVYDDLQKQGLRYSSIRLREDGAFVERIVFPGAIVTYRERSTPVQLLKSQVRVPDADMVNRSINNLEYELASAIRRVVATQRPRVAFLEGHGELGAIAVADITQALEEQYDVSRVRIDGRIDALSRKGEGIAVRLNTHDALIIAKPDSAFSDRDRYVVDQFVMNGGKVLWLVDAMNANLDSLRKNQFSIATPLELGLQELLFSYGVRINNDLVLDRSCAPIEIFTQPYGDQRKLERFPWYFEPVSVPQSTHPVVANVDPVHFRFGSSLDTIAADGVRKTILLTSSPASFAQRNPVRISLNMVELDMGFEKRSTPFLPMAVLLEGRFTSPYADRLPPAFREDRDVAFKEQSKETAMIVVADGDVIANRVDAAKGMFYPLGYDRYANTKLYGNREFIVNAMNYLLDDKSLISIRSRELTLRQLDPVRTERERTMIQLFNLVLPVLLTIGGGLLLHFLRRRRSNTRS